MRTDPEKIKAVMEAKEPSSMAELRSFLGLCNFSSNFVSNYSMITSPLREMTKKGAHFEWTTEGRDAFKKLKESICREQTLRYFDPHKKTRVYVDGSKKDGIGSILAQYDSKTDNYQPVRYNSRPLKDAETRYSQIEVESLAVHFGITKNHIYLYGLQDFEVITDHLPLLPLYNKYKQEVPPRIKHHQVMTQGYNFKLLYEKGSTNPSDYLSRYPVKAEREVLEEQHELDLDVNLLIKWALPNAITVETMQQSTSASEEMNNLRKAIDIGYIPIAHTKQLHSYKKLLSELSVEEGLIMRGERIVVPPEIRSKVVKVAHESHLGAVKTKQLIKETMWFPKIDEHVKLEIQDCLPCQAVNSGPQQEPIKPSVLPEEPWSSLVSDLYGPLPTGEYLLVVQDMYSRFPAVEILHSTKAPSVISALDRIMSNFGIPDTLGSDNGPPYNSDDLDKFAVYMGYSHDKKTPYAPWANGMAETFMRSLKKLMQTCKIEQSNWRQQLQRFLRAYRAAPHKSTGFAPSTVMFNGRRYKTRLPTKKMYQNVFIKEMKEADNKSKQRMKRYADHKSYVKENDTKVGDWVLVKQLKKNKLTPAYNPEPYEVIRRNGSQIIAKRYDKVIKRHVNHFKKVNKNITGATPPRFQRGVEEDIFEPLFREDETMTDVGFGGEERMDREGNRRGAEGQSDTAETDADRTLGQAEDETRFERPQRIRRKPARYRDENFV